MNQWVGSGHSTAARMFPKISPTLWCVITVITSWRYQKECAPSVFTQWESSLLLIFWVDLTHSVFLCSEQSSDKPLLVLFVIQHSIIVFTHALELELMPDIKINITVCNGCKLTKQLPPPPTPFTANYYPRPHQSHHQSRASIEPVALLPIIQTANGRAAHLDTRMKSQRRAISSELSVCFLMFWCQQNLHLITRVSAVIGHWTNNKQIVTRQAEFPWHSPSPFKWLSGVNSLKVHPTSLWTKHDRNLTAMSLLICIGFFVHWRIYTPDGNDIELEERETMQCLDCDPGPGCGRHSEHWHYPDFVVVASHQLGGTRPGQACHQIVTTNTH